MDVRCESCGTEYELDDSKLKAGGVTVKCASCGHMFKIRKRGSSVLAPAPTASAPPARRPRPSTQQGVTRPAAVSPLPQALADSPSAPVQMATSDSGPIKKKRTWLVRGDDGEVKSCRELAKLQQWIVEGVVDRNSKISRNGKTWKPLGEISELAMFFDVADEANAARVASGRDQRQPTEPPPPPMRAGVGSVPPKRAPRASTPPPVPAHKPPSRAPTPGPTPAPVRASTPNPAPRPAASAASAPQSPPPAEQSTPVPAPAAVPQRPVDAAPSGPKLIHNKPGLSIPKDIADQSAGKWASAQPAIPSSGDAGPSGPTGGLSRGVPTTDAAFAGGNKELRRLATEPPPELDSSSFDSFDSLDSFDGHKRGGSGLWIALGSVVVIGAALAVVYFLVFRDDGAANDEPVVVADVGYDASAPIASRIDEPPVPANENPLVVARAALLGDSQLILEELSKQLKSSDAKIAELVALRSRIEGALAQHLVDEASAADAGEKRKLRAKAKRRAKTAETLAKAALAIDKKSVDANVAMADAVRLRGRRSSDVRRWLRKARASDSANRDATYVEAMAHIRDNKKLKASRLLRKLLADAEKLGDVRPRYRTALLAFADKRNDEARDGAKQVLQMHAGHPGAVALMSRIDAATSVATSDPMPPEAGGDGDGSSSSRHSGAMSYDRLLSKADKKAESGDCKGARKLYLQALDINPAGVGALTGMGYCHVEAHQFSSAQAKFRAALSISPRYVDALLGVAEAYQQQGLKKQAIRAYRAFLSTHPGSSRGPQIKRQIERLGGSSSSKPPADKPPADKPPADEPPVDKPPADKPPADKPPADKPPADESPADEPADKPAADKPAADKPEPKSDGDSPSSSDEG